MTQPNLERSYDTNTSSHANYSFMELVQEMRVLGMDPKPILSIAANDIFNRLGSKSLGYIKSILDQMVNENNTNGMYLWREIHDILSDRFSASHITIH